MPATKKLPARRRRGRFPPPLPVDLPVQRRDRDRRAIVIGVIGTLVFHILFFAAVPESFVALAPLDPAERELARDFEITVVDEEEAEREIPDQPPEPRYVETNPEVPDNEPDDTTNISARNQQAANEITPEGLSPDRTPARDGEEDLPFDKAFAGSYEQEIPIVAAPATPEQQPQQGQDGSDLPMAVNPPSGFDETRGDDPEGIASSVARPAPNPDREATPAEGAETAPRPALPEIAASIATPERPAPAPRPRLPRASPGPVKRQPLGVTQNGRTAVDARFGPFGDYLERLQEAVSLRWEALGRQRSISESQTRVVLEFKLTRDGLVRDLETVETTSQALGILLCRTAIEQGQSFGVWSQEMVDLLGEEQKITFTFYYW